jgi:hypothetical protein
MITNILESEGNLRATDRVLSLEVVDGKSAKTTTGLLDSRLFDGRQKLHLKMDIASNLWNFQYESNGLLPEGLRGRFTSFNKGLEHAQLYFAKRNVRVTEILD